MPVDRSAQAASGGADQGAGSCGGVDASERLAGCQPSAHAGSTPPWRGKLAIEHLPYAELAGGAIVGWWRVVDEFGTLVAICRDLEAANGLVDRLNAPASPACGCRALVEAEAVYVANMDTMSATGWASLRSVVANLRDLAAKLPAPPAEGRATAEGVSREVFDAVRGSELTALEVSRQQAEQLRAQDAELARLREENERWRYHIKRVCVEYIDDEEFVDACKRCEHRGRLLIVADEGGVA
jgi:hypothetical protein